MRARFGLAVVAAGLLCSPALTQSAEQASAEENRLTIPDVNVGTRIICRDPGPRPGSRIGGRRICKTEAEWNRLQSEGVQTQYMVVHSAIREGDSRLD